MIRIGGKSMLLNSTGVIPRSQHEEGSALLRDKIEELNKNTVLLIAEAEKLIQESRQLSERIKSLENASTKPKWLHQRTLSTLPGERKIS
jgi:predicted nuclease with TOPRIM domain